MYVDSLRNPKAQKKFREVCNAFGFDYDGKDVLLSANE